MPTMGDSIWARNAPQLFPIRSSGRSLSISVRICCKASLGCKGRSGVKTIAWVSRDSFKTVAIGQLPVAKNPCRNRIFFICRLFFLCKTGLG